MASVASEPADQEGAIEVLVAMVELVGDFDNLALAMAADLEKLL
jgi:hypothetical protein